jgi:uncharacterized protein (TIGR02391 family)
MATRKAPPAAPQPANLSPIQIRAAIPKLQRRHAELKSTDLSSIRDRGDPKMKGLQQKLDDTLVEIFGNESLEYNRYRISTLDRGPMVVSMGGYGPSPSKVQEGYREGVERAVTTIETILELLNEKLSDMGEGVDGRSLRTLESLDLHEEIADAVVELFKGQHYANAVEDACKVLDLLVKTRSRRDDLSGTELMQVVFSPKAPVLKFNELQTDSEKSEQQGMMSLYAGVMLAFRNPRAHGLIEDQSESALEIIGIINYLAKALARSKRVTGNR